MDARGWKSVAMLPQSAPRAFNGRILDARLIAVAVNAQRVLDRAIDREDRGIVSRPREMLHIAKAARELDSFEDRLLDAINGQLSEPGPAEKHQAVKGDEWADLAIRRGAADLRRGCSYAANR